MPKLEKKHNYVYRLEYIKDSRYYYLGVLSTNLNPAEDNYMGSGKQVWNLGQENFQKHIILDVPTRKEALNLEEQIIGSLWKTDPFCLNRCPGGQKGGKFDNTGLIVVSSGFKMRLIDPNSLKLFEQEGWVRGPSEEKREKARKASTGQHRKPGVSEKIRLSKIRLGSNKHSEETKRKIGLANSGKIHTEEQKQRLRTLRLGKKHTQETKDRMRKAHTGRKYPNRVLSEEHKQHIGDSVRGKKRSEEFKQRMREKMIGRNVGKVWISDSSGKSKMISKDDLQKFVEIGWKLGRKYGK